MNFFYQLKSLLGTVYKKGDILFSHDGYSIISPVGNKISLFDLKAHKCFTLPVESKYDYTSLDISPDGSLLICINEAGDTQVVSMITLATIHRYHLKSPANCVKFSPNGRYIAIGKGSSVIVFTSPGFSIGEFNPFVVKKIFRGFMDDVTCLSWSTDSRLVGAGSKDGTIKLFSVNQLKNFRLCTFGSHNDSIVSVFFELNSLDICTLSRGGILCLWEANIELVDLIDKNDSDMEESKKETDILGRENDIIDKSRGEVDTLEEGEQLEKNRKTSKNEIIKYKQISKQNLCSNNNSVLTCAVYSPSTHILVTGYSNGSIHLHELPDVSLIQSLCITENSTSNLCINQSGEWIAIASEERGQLLVWEWQSETYVMKQQGHSTVISSLAYSHDGLYLVTGGEDGLVKLWNVDSGFCFVTFNEHSSCITSVKFSPNRKFVLSSSLDGTIRAFDLMRYRNFRTFTSYKPVQFISLALDSSGEFIAAGGQDVFEIFVWSLKTGKLLEVLSGHEGPVVSLAFSPSLMSTELVSVSWDKTFRLWNAIEKNTLNDVTQLSAEGIWVAYRPDGKEIVVSTQDGNLMFFDTFNSKQTSVIEGRNDLGSARRQQDLITPKTALKSKSFSCVCYSSDGKYVIAGGDSKNVCVYNVATSMLINKIEITQNRSLDGVNEMYDRKKMTEFGNIALIEDRESGFGRIKLPGVRRGDLASRKNKPEIRVVSIEFSPSGKEWAVSTTEGFLVYSVEKNTIFNPLNLTEDITTHSVYEALKEKRYAEALTKALSLNENNIVKNILEQSPYEHASIGLSYMTDVYCERLLDFIVKNFDSSIHIEFYIFWLKSLFKKNINPSLSTLVTLEKSLHKYMQLFSKMCYFNKFSIQYLKRMSVHLPEINENKNVSDLL